MLRRIVAVSFALLLLAGACARRDVDDTGRADEPADVDEGRDEDAEPETSEPEPSVVEAIEWESCSGGRECATVDVPLDYDAPDGATIELAVARLPARGDRIGAVFVNFGGPGGSAADVMHLYPYPDEILDRFDIVGMDPRGVGASTPLDCGLDAATLYAVDPTMEDDADREAFVDISEDYAQDCADERGEMLPFVGTRNVARDIDRLREAMGDETIDYLGYSYGTSIGQAYAEEFPDNVRTMILDGLVDVGMSGLDQAVGQAVGFETALDNWAAGCTARGCSLDDPVAAVERALSLAEGGVPAGDATVGPGEIATGLAYPLYAESLWPALDNAVDGMLSNDGTGMLGLSDSYTGLADFSVYFAVSCLDNEWPDNPEAFFAAGKDAADVAPHFGEALIVDYLRCAVWPVEPDPLGPIEAVDAPPILVVSTTGDPATPFENGVAVAERLASGVLVVNEGEGHTVVFSGSDDCIDDIAVDYLVDLTVPEDGVTC